MGTRFKGTFVIPWLQTELDGRANAPVDFIRVGACWSWTGEPLRLDGPSGVLPLGPSQGQTDLRRRAAAMVRRLLAGATEPVTIPGLEPHEELFSRAMLVTDGLEQWEIALVPGADGGLLAMALDRLPPRDTELWIVRHGVDRRLRAPATSPRPGVICFTPGTRILTESGPRDVAALREGDRIQTQDNGPAEILWLASRRISGARLRATPDLAPVRLRAGALDRDVPDEGLLVSPDHRLVLRGPRARALWNEDEVLVSARDLVNDRTILREPRHREVTYIHLMLPRHEIVFANGVASESFHPASAALDQLTEDDHRRLFDRLPDLGRGLDRFGPSVRRCLGRGEAAVMHAG